jgi:hypothetical protein
MSLEVEEELIPSLRSSDEGDDQEQGAPDEQQQSGSVDTDGGVDHDSEQQQLPSDAAAATTTSTAPAQGDELQQRKPQRALLPLPKQRPQQPRQAVAAAAPSNTVAEVWRLCGSIFEVPQLDKPMQQVQLAYRLFDSPGRPALARLFGQLEELAERLRQGQVAAADLNSSTVLNAVRGVLLSIERQYLTAGYSGRGKVHSLLAPSADSPHQAVFSLPQQRNSHFCLWHGAGSHSTMKCKLLLGTSSGGFQTSQQLARTMLCHPQGCISYFDRQRNKMKQQDAAKRVSSATAPEAKRQHRAPGAEVAAAVGDPPAAAAVPTAVTASHVVSSEVPVTPVAATVPGPVLGLQPYQQQQQPVCVPAAGYGSPFAMVPPAAGGDIPTAAAADVCEHAANDHDADDGRAAAATTATAAAARPACGR